LKYFEGVCDLQSLSKKDVEKLAELKLINPSKDPKGEKVAEYIRSQAKVGFKEMKYVKIRRQKGLVSNSKTAQPSSTGMQERISINRFLLLQARIIHHIVLPNPKPPKTLQNFVQWYYDLITGEAVI
jgi:hypothetical protein